MIILKHPSGLMKECPEGFSWTTFFFGPFVPLIRGMHPGVTIGFFIFQIITSGFFGFFAAFFINKEYIKKLIEEGYSPSSEIEKQKLAKMGIVLHNFQEKITNDEINDLEIKLEKLQKMKEKGLISENDFQEAKKNIIHKTAA